MNKRNELIISEDLSISEMETLLIQDDISKEDKEKIKLWIYDFRQKLKNDKCDFKNNEYSGVYSLLNLFTDKNKFWKLAQIQLCREGHPDFSEVGSGQKRRIICTNKQALWDIYEKMNEIKSLYDKNHARFEVLLKGK